MTKVALTQSDGILVTALGRYCYGEEVTAPVR
jgi:hypothetical protein